MPFTTEAASLNAKPGKPKLHLSAQSSLTSENVFGSAHVKIGVWIKAGPQPLFPAEPGVKNG